MAAPTDLLDAELRSDGSRPFLTFYDDASGERVELSVATTANWVAKTANYLLDEHGVQDGDEVSILLPVHWQAAIVILATWATGARVSFDPGGLLTISTAPDPATETVILTLAPMGADFSRLVAAQPDQFAAISPSGADVVAAAASDLAHGARVLTTIGYDVPGGLSYGLVSPLAVSGSVVLVANADPATIADHAATERVTHTVGATIDGLPRLDRAD